MTTRLAFTLLIGALLAACGGGDDNPSGPRLLQQIAVPGVGAGTNYSFDIGAVSGSTYYYTDRNNKGSTSSTSRPSRPRPRSPARERMRSPDRSRRMRTPVRMG